MDPTDPTNPKDPLANLGPEPRLLTPDEIDAVIDTVMALYNDMRSQPTPTTEDDQLQARLALKSRIRLQELAVVAQCGIQGRRLNHGVIHGRVSPPLPRLLDGLDGLTQVDPADDRLATSLDALAGLLARCRSLPAPSSLQDATADRFEILDTTLRLVADFVLAIARGDQAHPAVSERIQRATSLFHALMPEFERLQMPLVVAALVAAKPGIRH